MDAFLPAGLSQILVIVFVLAVIWIAIKLVFKLARAVLAAGCFVILVIGVILVVARLAGG